MADPFRFADELGPAKILQLYEPALGLKAVLAVDNVAAGPAIGGLRMAPDVSIAERFRLARAMTLKNAAAGLPRQGGDLRRPQATRPEQGGARSGVRRRDRADQGLHPRPRHGHRRGLHGLDQGRSAARVPA
jgi:hypothetical protein